MILVRRGSLGVPPRDEVRRVQTPSRLRRRRRQRPSPRRRSHRRLSAFLPTQGKFYSLI